MATLTLLARAAQEGWTDEDVVQRVLEGDTPLYEILMRRYNQRLYRVARAILRDDGEAEDVMQDAFVRAYQHLAAFEGRAKFATWLTRIAIHEALARSRRRERMQPLETTEESRGDVMSTLEAPSPTPERSAYDRELGVVLEKAILQLPEDYRLVFTLREVNEMSTAETAACLNLTEENVKVRLHRARALLRRELFAQAGATAAHAFQFHALRCDRVVKGVFRRISNA
jgi:RNA polymerase sigma-70 factor (ECF subfamily)